jgi:deoxyribose-phosphate aldolase
MLQLEYFAYEPTITNEEYQESIFLAIEYKFDIVSIPLYNLAKMKEFIIGPKISVAIDFPYGNSISQIKLHSIIQASRNGANIIDVVLNNNMILNGQSHELSKELSSYIHATKSNKTDIRIIMDYRIFSDDQMAEVCFMLAKAGIGTVITNTGRFVDDLSDNILLCRKIKKNFGMKAIITAPILTKDMLQTVKSAGVDGIRFLSMKTAKNILT